MKAMFAAIMILTSLSSFASIRDSKYDARHIKAIKSAIQEKCGNIRDLAEVSSSEQVIRIDQGIRDVRYTTVISGVQRIDQGIFDYYRITVSSYYADSYDHEARDWGSYSVESLKCELE